MRYSKGKDDGTRGHFGCVCGDVRLWYNRKFEGRRLSSNNSKSEKTNRLIFTSLTINKETNQKGLNKIIT